MKIERSIPLTNTKSVEERQADQDRQLREAAKMYEQHFMREMVKAMRQSVPEGGLVPTNFGEKIFREQLDSEYVSQWGERGGVGFADMIYNHVKERYFPDQKHWVKPEGPLPIEGWRAKVKGPKLEFKGEEGLPPKARELRAPWPGKLTRAFTNDVGISLVEVQHDQGLVSRFVFPGAVRAPAGSTIGGGELLGEVQTAVPWLQWNLAREAPDRTS